jgi:hypothetical protein
MRAALVVTAVFVALAVGLLMLLGVFNLMLAAAVVAMNAAIPYFAGLVLSILLLDALFPRKTAPPPPAE